MVDGVVEEQDLSRFDKNRSQEQDIVIDQEFDSVTCDGHEDVHDRGEQEHGADGSQSCENAGGEVIHQHLEAGADLACP